MIYGIAVCKKIINGKPYCGLSHFSIWGLERAIELGCRGYAAIH